MKATQNLTSRRNAFTDNDSNDVCRILTSAFLTFTMQTGYSLLESGVVSRKNEVNITTELYLPMSSIA